MLKMALFEYSSEPSFSQRNKVRVKSDYSSVTITIPPVENVYSLPCLPLWRFGAYLSGWCGGHVSLPPQHGANVLI